MSCHVMSWGKLAKLLQLPRILFIQKCWNIRLFNTIAITRHTQLTQPPNNNVNKRSNLWSGSSLKTKECVTLQGFLYGWQMCHLVAYPVVREVSQRRRSTSKSSSKRQLNLRPKSAPRVSHFSLDISTFLRKADLHVSIIIVVHRRATTRTRGKRDEKNLLFINARQRVQTGIRGFLISFFLRGFPVIVLR